MLTYRTFELLIAVLILWWAWAPVLRINVRDKDDNSLGSPAELVPRLKRGLIVTLVLVSLAVGAHVASELNLGENAPPDMSPV